MTDPRSLDEIWLAIEYVLLIFACPDLMSLSEIWEQILSDPRLSQGEIDALESISNRKQSQLESVGDALWGRGS